MIEYTIRESLGIKSAVSVVKCDGCGNGVSWGPGKCSGIPKGDQLRGFMRNEGWSIKKKHLCKSCAAQKKSESGGTSANKSTCNSCKANRRTLTNVMRNRLLKFIERSAQNTNSISQM